MKVILKMFKEWLTIGKPIDEYVCADCGESYIFFLEAHLINVIKRN